ncbi:MAG: [protein-PII] uridylyltransferase [Rhodospirillales bacterium]|nr:[protein-PII] uridylyltransferase [Rhodospirillales bacterium]
MNAPSPEPAPPGALKQKRGIIDRAALQAELATLVQSDLTPDRTRSRVLATLKAALGEGQAEVRRRFEAGAKGTQTVRANCFLIDQVLRLVYDHVCEHLYPLANPSKGERLALVAVGGYGRGELAPYSDVDLLFLLPYKITPRSEQVIEAVLYLLWDLGLKVGHATRSVDDCLRLAKDDMTIRTALLEKRFLWGDQALFLELKQRYQKGLQSRGPIKFIEAKLAEREARHKRFGYSRYVLEPNIKEGKGGLRDLQTLFWIAKYLYQVEESASLIERGVFTKREAERFEKAHNYLWTLRCHLHYLAGRAEERLTFDLQMQIAPRMGYKAHAGTRDVERLMKHYFLTAKDVGDLTRIFCAALEADHKRAPRFRLRALTGRRRLAGFRVEGDRLDVKGPEVFAEKPVEMLRIFKVAQDHDLDIHPRALRWITQNLSRIDKTLRQDPAANRIFLDILTSPKDPEIALRRLNEAGVFGRFVPDFGRVVAQMQYNMYHHFTVDEHTIFAIGILHQIERGRLREAAPIASEVVHKVLNRKVLYLALLLHDIAKGRPGDHSVVGAKIAQRLCARLGLSGEETETVAWLVLHHLAMSNTAFKRDLDDPKTIEPFAGLVQSMERLRLLLVLTVADIRAVGPGTWNSWKAALLRELYWRTEEVLSGGLATEGREARVKAAKAALGEALRDWPKKDLAAHLARGYPSYWLSVDTEGHARHARMVRAAEKAGHPLTVDTRVDRYREATEITIYTADHPGLFSRIAGAMAVAGASIEAARIFTLKNGMALDSFYVRDAQGGPFDRPDKLAKLAAAVEQTLSGRLKPLQELAKRRSTIPSRLRVFEVQPRVLIDNKASARHTVIEVNGRDRPGLLYQVTLALTKQQLIIHRAKISTYGERAVDVFYVQTALGGKVESEAKLKRLRDKLLEALEQPSAKPARPAKPTKTPAKKAPAGKAPRKSPEQAAKAAGKAAAKATGKTTGAAAE